jgi:Phage capsid family
MSKKKESGPSLTEAILDLVEFGVPRNTEIAEDHYDIQRQIKSTPELNGIMTSVGGRALYVPLNRLARRDMSVGGANVGSGFVGEMVQPIASDLLSWSAVQQQGAVFLTGLRERTRIPLVTKLPVPEWHPEIGLAGAASAQLTTEQVILAPFRLSCRVTVTRMLMATAVSNFDSTLTSLIGAALSSYLDQAVLYGSGAANNQPLGILSHPDTLKFDPAAGTLWETITSMEAAVTNANAGTATLGSIMSPEAWRRMRTEGVYGPGLGDLISAQITRPIATPECFNEHLFVAVWGMCTVGVFNALSIIVNPYGQGVLNGTVEIVADLFCDVALRCPPAFAVTSAPIVRGSAEEPIKGNGKRNR